MNFLPKVENVSVIVNDTLADYENIDEGDHDPELQNLVEEWNLCPSVYAILIQHGYSVQYLKMMDDRSLDDVFSVVKWTGHKYALRQKLVLWPESVLFQSASTSSTSRNAPAVDSTEFPATSTVQSSSLKHRLLPTSVTSELLNDILNRNEKGKIVVNFFGKHQCLDSSHRKFLAHTIVDYYIANDMYFPLPDMAKFAQLIADRFSMELAETYYNPRDAKAEKKHPSGLIYDRFHNRNKKRLVRAKSSETENTYCKEKSIALSLPEDEITKLSTLKNWLRNNFAPTDEVQAKWKESMPLRLRAIIDEVDIEKCNVLSEWPRITDETGYLLIDSDFDHLFGKSDKLFNDWEEFSENFLNYVRINNIKDERSRKLMHILEESTICQGGRDVILCFVFHALIKPTRRANGKLPTILEAQLDVCYLCDTYDEYIEAIQTTRQECATAKIQVAPRIYAVGSFENIEEFYVATGKIEYRLPSFLRCLDVIIKLKHVLDYPFPESCEILWCFITSYLEAHRVDLQ
ncbi:uncharacterized protein LOC110678890 isoform X2 [Aedes aegypti]|uniref:Uncharacterized protein n=1 Tax=Aedes aegypti TaxID=7159 RepID=A0A6I8TT72_AEDAE|nr:uncharacterized protein LOC110678890 isoform X2 [Aedes aegypti]